jgi:hypothetical protein
MRSSYVRHERCRILVSLLLLFPFGCRQATQESKVLPHTTTPNPSISEEEAKEIATTVARTKFEGKGAAGSPLRIDQITVRFDAAQPGSAQSRPCWHVMISEEAKNREPSGLQIIIDAETGNWERQLRE